MFEEPPIEYDLYQDDAKMIADMIRDGWSLGPDLDPTITYIPESFMANARVAHIHVYRMTTSYAFASIDYRNMTSTTYIGVRIGTRYRENHFKVVREVQRILAANRRAGPKYLNGYQFLHVVNVKQQNDPSGWYVTSIEIRLVNNAIGYKTAGFGDEINRRIQEVDPAVNGDSI